MHGVNPIYFCNKLFVTKKVVSSSKRKEEIMHIFPSFTKTGEIAHLLILFVLPLEIKRAFIFYQFVKEA